jgi:hypothetical protein
VWVAFPPYAILACGLDAQGRALVGFAGGRVLTTGAGWKTAPVARPGSAGAGRRREVRAVELVIGPLQTNSGHRTQTALLSAQDEPRAAA